MLPVRALSELMKSPEIAMSGFVWCDTWRTDLRPPENPAKKWDSMNLFCYQQVSFSSDLVAYNHHLEGSWLILTMSSSFVEMCNDFFHCQRFLAVDQFFTSWRDGGTSSDQDTHAYQGYWSEYDAKWLGDDVRRNGTRWSELIDTMSFLLLASSSKVGLPIVAYWTFNSFFRQWVMEVFRSSILQSFHLESLTIDFVI